MADSSFLATKRYAVVTGGNKGIGLEICRQLAFNGVTVVLTARDKKKGMEAVENLHQSGLADFVIFHQLDVLDSASIASLADFVESHFGKLDILVNNAATVGLILDSNAVKAAVFNAKGPLINWNEVSTRTYDTAEECIKVNYKGARKMVDTFLLLLQLSDSPRIVNVSSMTGVLKFVTNEGANRVLSDAENLTEERVDRLLQEFLQDLKEGVLETKGWNSYLSAYTLSKAALNAYTRILAKKYPRFMINSVCPGYVKTGINCFTGILSTEEGAQSPVRLALSPAGGVSGMFFSRTDVVPF
ncbi:hypothetical protein DCAR_0414750 [Daucus carota subsp. sativus]|uniref:Short-chain dehydrogenase/reductase n=1 Tax=Daucus carota subsp. sativus TaxID=79200 RepID=A0AAF1AWV5_DAUCS|nr:PREDICTED: (+)-neomenthol dehydrogenase-like isoform X1 [Daucus carota subsp. sativus]WOG95431.1 hypothetical protein DCAR_0414750 [Daucus carota subsp. sativus]